MAEGSGVTCVPSSADDAAAAFGKERRGKRDDDGTDGRQAKLRQPRRLSSMLLPIKATVKTALSLSSSGLKPLDSSLITR